jgi:hypothetical protein
MTVVLLVEIYPMVPNLFGDKNERLWAFSFQLSLREEFDNENSTIE